MPEIDSSQLPTYSGKKKWLGSIHWKGGFFEARQISCTSVQFTPQHIAKYIHLKWGCLPLLRPDGSLVILNQDKSRSMTLGPPHSPVTLIYRNGQHQVRIPETEWNSEYQGLIYWWQGLFLGVVCFLLGSSHATIHWFISSPSLGKWKPWTTSFWIHLGCKCGMGGWPLNWNRMK